jgi:hypothetical protein
MSASTQRVGFGPFRVWHLGLLVLFVAIAIANVQDQRRREPALITLAAAGFVVYGLMSWIGWHLLSRLKPRLGPMLVLILYLVSLAILFFASTVVYLVIEQIYLY